MSITKYPFTLPQLPYDYNALEPFIDAETMHYHHDKHLASYIKNLNAALEPYPQLKAQPLDQILRKSRSLPPSAREAIMHNGGGVYNHTLFFQGLSPADSAGQSPEGSVEALILRQFGSVEEFKKQFSAAAMNVFGSGWTYLVITRERNLRIMSFHDQDTPAEQGLKPVLTFDLWEHAYYLKYKNERANYIEALWSVINFPIMYGI